MESSDRTLDLSLGVDEHDELDRKIDRALGRVGALVRTLFVLAILAFVGLFVIYPQWDVMGPFITTGLYLVFQLFYVAFLMIFQFIVLFWFIGRPRIYWLMPGEAGGGFKDLKGQPRRARVRSSGGHAAEGRQTLQADGWPADSRSAARRPARHRQELSRPGHCHRVRTAIRLHVPPEHPGHVLGHGHPARAQPL